MGSLRTCQTITPFRVLLGTISNLLGKSDVRRIKVHLQGHVNKECLEKLRVGHHLIDALCQRGLLTDKKLAFFRKLLLECELVELVDLVDDFKSTSQASASEGSASGTSRVKKRLQNLAAVIERLNKEIANYRAEGDELRSRLEEKQAMLDGQKEVSITHYEVVDSLCDKAEEADLDRDMTQERAVEIDEVIKIQQGEVKSLKTALENSRPKKTMKDKRISVFDAVLDKHSKKSLELAKQKENKEETLKKSKETGEETWSTLYSKREILRATRGKILEETTQLIDIDWGLLECYEEIRKAKQEIRKNEIDVFDLASELEETKEEFVRTEKNGVDVWKVAIPFWRLGTLQGKQQKVIDYLEVQDTNCYFIGSHGNKIDPPQFDGPLGLEVTRKDLLIAADHGNCRIHFLDQTGLPIREPITMKNTHPSSLAINRRGNIIISDSEIIKVFTSDGMLSHNFLPVYNKKDQRPSISAIALDRDGNILAADITNHRIQKFHIDGHFLGFIGGPAYLHMPSGIAVTKQGDVIVSEYDNHMLKIFHHHGRSFNTLGRPGIGKGQFMCPRGLAVDNAGNILVADSMNHRIQVVTMDGEFLSSFGRLGSSPGCLDTPYAVSVNRRGHVFVAESGNHRVTVFT